MQTGKPVCTRPDPDNGGAWFAACPFPCPELDALSLETLELFTAMQTQWMRVPMFGGKQSDRRVGIPRTEVRIEADARGIELNEVTLDKFAQCEYVLINLDIEKANSE